MVIPSSPDSRPSIVLTGFMGVGKTTIGRAVAERLSWPFIDTDAVIAVRAGKSIARIFADEGETAFRALERRLAHELAQRRGLVIATGGGMLVDADNRQQLSQNGVIICLDASAPVIADRLRRSTDRPLADNWQHLLAARQQAYAAIAHHVMTDGRPVDEIAGEVMALWQSALK